jgi:DNA-binding response OmpR family regulator
MRILVVEDDPSIADVIRRGLHDQDYSVDLAFAGDEGESMALRNRYDLIMLDLMLPRRSGTVICSHLRRAGIETPIMLMTAYDGVTQREEGLRAGANDYITKPFNFTDLLARVRALIGGEGRDNVARKVVDIAGLRIDGDRHAVSRNERQIPLTAKEYALLEYFIANRDRVLTHAMISEHVWQMSFDPLSNIIDSTVRYLKKKIDGSADLPLIHAVSDVGYRFSDMA